jgi:hypothetical protein
VSSSSLSPHRRAVQAKDASDVALHQPHGVLGASSLLLAAGDAAENGGFQMDRYIHDDRDSAQGRLDEVLAVAEADRVDSSILQAFDPLGYAQVEQKSSRDSEYDDTADSDSAVVLKTASSDICLSCHPSDSVAGGDLIRSSWLSGSAGSLIDLRTDSQQPPSAAAGGSLVSVETLTAKDGASRESVTSERLDNSSVSAFKAATHSCDISETAAPAQKSQVTGGQGVESGLRARPALVVSNGKAHDVIVKPSQLVDVGSAEDNGGSGASYSSSPRTNGKSGSIVVTPSVCAAIAPGDGSKVDCLL